MNSIAKIWWVIDVMSLIKGFGSATLGNKYPKNLIGYFEKIDPIIPEIGITIMHVYKRV